MEGVGLNKERRHHRRMPPDLFPDHNESETPPSGWKRAVARHIIGIAILFDFAAAILLARLLGFDATEAISKAAPLVFAAATLDAAPLRGPLRILAASASMASLALLVVANALLISLIFV